jgi:hypothetical protein
LLAARDIRHFELLNKFDPLAPCVPCGPKILTLIMKWLRESYKIDATKQ